MSAKSAADTTTTSTTRPKSCRDVLAVHPSADELCELGEKCRAPFEQRLKTRPGVRGFYKLWQSPSRSLASSPKGEPSRS